MKPSVLVLSILFGILLNIRPAFSQYSLVPRIENQDTTTVNYCTDSVLVAPSIFIVNININEVSEGMKISIVNYKKDEDILVYNAIPNFTYYWDANYGHLEIKGIGTSIGYQEAVRNVFYKNIASVPETGNRIFTISLLDADYLPQTDHFYRFVSKTDISWKEARDSAANLKYYGLQGYLTTITSSTENDFIWTKIDGVGWIGASDEETEDVWKWVTGPEAGIQFWQGGINGYRISGRYSNWASGEPNNAGNEDFAHINQNPNAREKSWNDLENEGDGPNSQYYRSRGFIVEFGGMPGDPEVKLSAAAKINVSKIAFSDLREFEICKGQAQQLNLQASDIYNYNWTPAGDLNDATISNPVANPLNTTTYKAIGTLDFCVDSAEFKVKVNPIPEHSWDKLYTICEGSNLELNPGKHTSYLWGNLDTTETLLVSNEGWYKVKLTNEFTCTKKDSTQVKWSKIPKLNYGDLDTLVCGEKQQKLNLTFDDGNATTQLSTISGGVQIANENTLSPLITVDEFGVYSFKMEIEDQFQCSFTDTLKIEFHNQPKATFQIDEAQCEGYNLKLNFTGITEENAWYYWYSNDTVFNSGNNFNSIEIPLGYGVLNRSVGLKINEQGCVDSLRIPVTVTPVLDFWAENPEGCTPLSVQFDYSASEPIDSFYWNFDGGIISNEEKPMHVFQNNGTEDKNYYVQLRIVSSEGCENIGFLNDLLVVHPKPTIDFDFNENECYSGLTEVNYLGSGNENDEYFWGLENFEPGEISKFPGNTSGPLEFARSSNPEVEIGLKMISQFGCETDSIRKVFKRKPLFKVELDKTEGCPPLESSFKVSTSDNADRVKYTWNLGNGTLETKDSLIYSYTDANKKYDITLVANSLITGCSDTLVLNEKINVFPVPKTNFEAVPNTVLVSNPNIEFTNLSEGASSFEWDFDDLSAISEEENPGHRFEEMGFYDVKLMAANELGCVDSTTQQVAVIFDRIFPPNAFSPNATIEEDREFRIYSKGILSDGYQLLIFNRWGEVIFESKAQEKGWNGKMPNGNLAPAGVYTWVLQYLDFRGEKYKQKGTVTLLF